VNTLEITRHEPSGALNLMAPGAGWEGLVFYVGLPEQARAQNGDLSAIPGGRLWKGDFEGTGLRVEVSLRHASSGAVIASPVLKNDGEEIRLTAYGFAVAEGARGPVLEKGHAHPVYAHSENLRVEETPFYGSQFPFIRPLGAAVIRLGDAPSGAVPALALGREGHDLWLVEGQWTRDSHRISWELQWGSQGRPLAARTSRFTWNGTEELVIPAGGSVDLESTVFQVVQEPADRIFAPYVAELKRHYSFAGTKSTLASAAQFCTWNYNVFTNIREQDCLERIGIAGRVMPGGWFQIDHGFQPTRDGGPAAYVPPDETGHTGTKASVEVDAYFPDPEAAWDLTRFPSGPKGIVGACKTAGIRPSIWWSPRVDRDGPIVRQHPEWILEDKDGNRLDVGHLLLDYSVPEVREFLENCVRTITREWGFEGMKLDFFSWMFDHPKARFRRGGAGLEWKRHFVRMIRSYLGDDGYFLCCISCPLGDPFLAIWGFDSWRAGVDIHSGEWQYHVRSVAWLLPSILLHGKETWFANIDSCLGKPEIPAVERRSRLDFAYMSGGMFEFSGRTERFTPDMLEEWRRLIERIDQGGEVRCPDQQAFYGRPLPRILVRPHLSESATSRNWGIGASIGLFNWGDEAQVVGFTAQQAGISEEAKLLDFWTGQEIAPRLGRSFSITLPPRGSLLLDANPCELRGSGIG